jgi:hypothetical protein
MDLENNELLPSEEIVLSKGANAVIKLSEYGLSKFAFGKYMWVVGLKGKESIGGKLHLTNYRLVFKSHRLNRVRGKFSIFLSTITGIRDTSVLITRKVAVSTKLREFEFIMWGIPAFIEAVQTRKAALGDDDIAKIQTYAVQYYERCGEGLEKFGGLVTLNKIFLEGEKIKNLIDFATNPIEAIGELALEELFDKSSE